jgi:hypothetical protein
MPWAQALRNTMATKAARIKPGTLFILLVFKNFDKDVEILQNTLN